jgi:hypothetical protein
MSAIEKFSVLLNIMLNILSVVGIVLVNKAVGSVDRFNFMVFLSFLHFVFTCICTRIMLSMNVFVYKDVNILDMLPVALVRTVLQQDASHAYTNRARCSLWAS